MASNRATSEIQKPGAMLPFFPWTSASKVTSHGGSEASEAQGIDLKGQPGPGVALEAPSDITSDAGV